MSPERKEERDIEGALASLIIVQKYFKLEITLSFYKS